MTTVSSKFHFSLGSSPGRWVALTSACLSLDSPVRLKDWTLSVKVEHPGAESWLSKGWCCLELCLVSRESCSQSHVSEVELALARGPFYSQQEFGRYLVQLAYGS